MSPVFARRGAATTVTDPNFEVPVLSAHRSRRATRQRPPDQHFRREPLTGDQRQLQVQAVVVERPSACFDRLVDAVLHRVLVQVHLLGGGDVAVAGPQEGQQRLAEARGVLAVGSEISEGRGDHPPGGVEVGGEQGSGAHPRRRRTT